MRPLLLVACGLALVACPPPTAEKKPAACTKVGESCEFSPGKLGACVKKDGCEGDGCFVCQSQH